MKSKKHLKKVSELSCMVCGVQGKTQAHHLLRTGEHGMALKSGDNWAVPLCFHCHNDLHLNGDEIGYFELNEWNYDIVKKYATELWDLNDD